MTQGRSPARQHLHYLFGPATPVLTVPHNQSDSIVARPVERVFRLSRHFGNAVAEVPQPLGDLPGRRVRGAAEDGGLTGMDFGG